MEITNECKNLGFSAGIIAGFGVKLGVTPDALNDKLCKLIERRKNQDFPPQNLKDGIRGMLRKGGFKPTGRNKPASEYLAQSAREGRFPFINNLVDINNYLSLLTGLPMTMLDLDISGENIALRTGRESENFIFNASGQIIDVEGLICTCRKNGPPLGNPVKDSLEAKIKDNTQNVLGVVYSPLNVINEDELKNITHEFAVLLKDYGFAKNTLEYIV